MTGSTQPDSVAAEDAGTSDAHNASVARYFAALEKVYLAEAELSRVKADLAKSGVNLSKIDTMR